MNFNPMEMMRNISGIQSKMEEIKKTMENISESGFAGGDMVRVDMNGKMQITAVKISSEAVDPSDTSMTEDLVKAACADAYDKIRNRINEEFSTKMGEMDIPPGFLGI